ncbi:MAG: response regulator transcription factor [Candidatus Dormibacteraeota bacterium]|nr:response regulator transcription factor [Candidatus Dormibacteraeota bacterium]
MNQMSAGRHAQTALVVDANPEVQQVLQLCLEGIGFRVELAEAAAAIDRFHQLAPDLVVVDLQPSGSDALRLCRRLREAAVVPIMVLNCSLGDTVKLAAFEAGADDHIDVPFQEKELVARARALMRRARWSPDRQGPIRVGEIEIRLDQREVLAAEQRLRFRPLEFDLLAFLARRPGRVHSRNELLDAVWGTDYPGGPRTVDSHVLELRRKLAQAEVVDPSIQTVWGVGYALEVKSRDRGPVRIPVSKYSPTAA